MGRIVNIRSLLSHVPQKAYIISGAIVILWGAWTANNYHQREIGKRDLLIAQHERTNADLRHQADSLSKVYRTDTLRLTKIRRVTDSLTVTVDQWKHDTVKVVEYVAKADSTIKVCSLALQTCEQRVSVAQRGWDGARDEIKLLKASMPSPAKKWLYGLAGVGVGYVAGRVQK